MKDMVVLCLILTVICGSLAANPWFNTFEPLREIYVSPVGGGDGSAYNNSLNFQQVSNNTGLAGDLYWLAGGNYGSGLAGQIFWLVCPGETNHPCLYRCEPNARCIFDGIIQIKSSYTWLWGIEIRPTNSDALAERLNRTLCLLNISSVPNAPKNTPTGVHIINNIFYPTPNVTTGICSNNDTGTVIYGNIIYGHGPNLYVTNDYSGSDSLYKYIVSNIFSDSFNASYDNLNAVSLSKQDGMGASTGLYLTKNIINNGHMTIGSMVYPDYENFFIRNIFSYSIVKVGIAQPGQAEVKGNLFSFSSFEFEYLWGQGESVNTQPTTITVVTNNTYFQTYRGRTILLGTLINFKDDRDKLHPISTDLQSTDIWNNNNYHRQSYQAHYQVHYVTSDLSSPSKWRTLTRNGGNQYDITSEFDFQTPTTDFYIVRNEYDPTRLNLVLFNYDQSSNIQNFNLCCFLRDQTAWTIYDFNSIYSNPIATEGSGCSSISVTFSSSTFIGVVFTRTPVTQAVLRNCSVHWVQDLEPSKITRVVPASTILSHDIITAGVVGFITLVILIGGTFAWYFIKKKQDAMESTINLDYGEQINELVENTEHSGNSGVQGFTSSDGSTVHDIKPDPPKEDAKESKI